MYRVSSLEVAISVILIHLINAIQHNVCIDLCQQGETTSPPWHSCFNLSSDASACQCMGKAVEVIRCWWEGSGRDGRRAVDEPPSNSLQWSLWWRTQEVQSTLILLSCHQVPQASWPLCSLMVYLYSSFPKGTNPSVLCTNQQVLNQRESQRKELIQITWALKALLSPVMPNNFALRHPWFPQLIDDCQSWHQEANKMWQWEGHKSWPRASLFLFY